VRGIVACAPRGEGRPDVDVRELWGVVCFDLTDIGELRRAGRDVNDSRRVSGGLVRSRVVGSWRTEPLSLGVADGR
jgi:hypothetical protein